MAPRALTFDYWETLYAGAVLPERITRRQAAGACAAVDDALLLLPPPLLRGTAAALRRLARHYRLAIVSDTCFASGRAQDRLLEKDGIRHLFEVTLYSADAGNAKPFAAAAAALRLPPHEILHVGDDERTDVRGAVAAGMRAVRLDAVRTSGPSVAERVVREIGELADYLVPDSLAITG